MTDLVTAIRQYDGPPVQFMEVCGTHTAAIAKNGIRSLLPENIRLVSGPGCPVCVTVTAYLDRLIALSKEPDTVVVSFGDLLRVPGSKGSLSDGKAEGGRVQMVYSPMEVLELARKNPDQTFVFAAVGFETTAPVYALLLKRAKEQGIENIRLLTSLKTMPPAIDWVCRQGQVDGFLAPGHVSVVTGSRLFEPLAERYRLPFAVAGFSGESILAALYGLTKSTGKGTVLNLYPSVVTRDGNRQAWEAVEECFVPCDAAWRGIGIIKDSGLKLKAEYERFDAGSGGLMEDREANRACRCAQVLVGRLEPAGCPLFGKACTPTTPQGACMVSTEGSCYHAFLSAEGGISR